MTAGRGISSRTDSGDRTRTPSSSGRLPKTGGSEITPSLEGEVEPNLEVTSEVEVGLEASPDLEVNMKRFRRASCSRKSKQSRRRMLNRRKLWWR